jgi:hypothetical protein
VTTRRSALQTARAELGRKRRPRRLIVLGGFSAAGAVVAGIVWAIPSLEGELREFDARVERLRLEPRPPDPKTIDGSIARHQQVLAVFARLREKAREQREPVAAVSRARIRELKSLKEQVRTQAERMETHIGDVDGLLLEFRLDRAYELERRMAWVDKAEWAPVDRGRASLQKLRQAIEAEESRRRKRFFAAIEKEFWGLVESGEFSRAQKLIDEFIASTPLTEERVKARTPRSTLLPRARSALAQLSTPGCTRERFDREIERFRGVVPEEEIRSARMRLR